MLISRLRTEQISLGLAWLLLLMISLVKFLNRRQFALRLLLKFILHEVLTVLLDDAAHARLSGGLVQVLSLVSVAGNVFGFLLHQGILVLSYSLRKLPVGLAPRLHSF